MSDVADEFYEKYGEALATEILQSISECAYQGDEEYECDRFVIQGAIETFSFHNLQFEGVIYVLPLATGTDKKDHWDFRIEEGVDVGTNIRYLDFYESV